MPVKKLSETEAEANFTINNGDLAALNRIKKQYSLKDSDDVIVFAIGILSQSNGRPVTVEKDDGSRIKLVPSDDLRRSEEDNVAD